MTSPPKFWWFSALAALIVCPVLFLWIGPWTLVGYAIGATGATAVAVWWARRHPPKIAVTAPNPSFRPEDVGMLMDFRDGDRWRVVEVRSATEVIVQRSVE